MNEAGNIFRNATATPAEERFATLFAGPGLRIERIVSQGQTSPPGFWYDQPGGEWVLVLEGAAALEIEGQTDPVRLGPGDYLWLPPHRRHRVAWTAPDRRTLWLAVHAEPG